MRQNDDTCSSVKPACGKLDLRSLFLLSVIIVTSFAACTPTVHSDEVPASLSTATRVEVRQLEETATIEATVTAPVESTLTVAPTATSRRTATPTAVPSPDITPTPEPEPTEGTVTNWEGEQLVVLRTDGIYRIQLDTDAVEQILNKEEEWELFGARLASGGEAAVYWFVQNGDFQVWKTGTVADERTQLLAIDDGVFVRANGDWQGHDSFFELALWSENEYGVPFVARWYLLDTVKNEIVGSATDRPGTRVCHTLAVSPQSNHVATWCSFDSQFKEQRHYTVIEADGELWQTEETPEEVLLITYELGEQIWSPNWTRVLVPGPSNAVMINVLEPNVEQLLDEDDIYVNTYAAGFSPDGQLLSYQYQLCEPVDGIRSGCVKLMDLASRAVVWESDGLYAGAYLRAWSPDSQFFILTVLNEDDYILRRSDFSVVRSLPIELGIVEWLD